MTTQTSDNNKRIAKNTLLLYFRMLFLMVVSLYTSRGDRRCGGLLGIRASNRKLPNFLKRTNRMESSYVAYIALRLSCEENV